MTNLSPDERKFIADMCNEMIARNKYDCDSVKMNITDQKICDKFINERHAQTLQLSAIFDKMRICACGAPIIGKTIEGDEYCEICRSDYEICAECGELYHKDTIKYDDDEVPYCENHYKPVYTADDKGCDDYHFKKENT